MGAGNHQQEWSTRAVLAYKNRSFRGKKKRSLSSSWAPLDCSSANFHLQDSQIFQQWGVPPFPPPTGTCGILLSLQEKWMKWEEEKQEEALSQKWGSQNSQGPLCQGQSILTVARASPAGVGAAPRLQATAGNRGAAQGGAAAGGSLRGRGRMEGGHNKGHSSLGAPHTLPLNTLFPS